MCHTGLTDQHDDTLICTHTRADRHTLRLTSRDGRHTDARGSCDDKGQFYMHIKAFEMMMKSKTLPCNLKFMIEGEEEIGSDNLGDFVKKNPSQGLKLSEEIKKYGL